MHRAERVNSRRTVLSRSGQPRRVQATRPLSKSYDVATARNMKAIKNSFYANDLNGRVLAPASVHSTSAMSSVSVVLPSPELHAQQELDDSVGFDEELCSLHDESVHDDDCDDEVASAGSFASGSAVGTFFSVGRGDRESGGKTSFAPTGIALWVAEAANQKLNVPRGKQPLDGLLSESEHYPSKNPDEIHPDMIGISNILLFVSQVIDSISFGRAGNNIWNRMKALEKLVDLQRKRTLRGEGALQLGEPSDRGDVPIQPGIQHWSFKDIEREIQQLSSDPTHEIASKRPKTGRLEMAGASAPDATMMVNGTIVLFLHMCWMGYAAQLHICVQCMNVRET